MLSALRWLALRSHKQCDHKVPEALDRGDARQYIWRMHNNHLHL